MRLEIVGPGTVAPGTTARFSVMQHVSDGSRQDVTSQAVWQSSNPAVLSISSTGVASAHQQGDAFISAATPQTAALAREIIVVPSGTYRLSGMVGDADNARSPIANARVEATGLGPALSTTTDDEGRYRLYGVAGETRVLVTKDAYNAHAEAITVADHQVRNFVLRLARSRPDVAGAYVLTIVAAASCRDQVPAPARRRTYTATLTQQGPELEAALSGTTFVLVRSSKGNRFRGKVDAQAVTFSLTPYDWYYKGYGRPYADIVELVDDSFFLVVDGAARLSVSSRELSGRLDGSFQVFNGDPRWAPPRVAECRAADHEFVLSRTQ